MTRLVEGTRAGGIPGRTWNRLVDNLESPQVAPPPLSGIELPTACVRVNVLNMSGQDLPEFGVAGYKEPAYTPGAIPPQGEADAAVLSDIVVVVESATVADHEDNFVLLLTPIANNGTGVGLLMGLTWARVDITDPTHTTAGIVDGYNDRLLSGRSGVDIKWKPAGTGLKWCQVMRGGGGGGSVSGEVNFALLKFVSFTPTLAASKRSGDFCGSGNAELVAICTEPLEGQSDVQINGSLFDFSNATKGQIVSAVEPKLVVAYNTALSDMYNNVPPLIWLALKLPFGDDEYVLAAPTDLRTIKDYTPDGAWVITNGQGLVWEETQECP